VLALDLGINTGWAMRLSSGVIVSGSQNFKHGRFDGGGMRFLRFQGWLQEIRSHGITQVAYEEVRKHKGVDASHVYGGFQAHLTAFCEQYQIPYEGVPVGTIKLHATGKGNASKNLVIAAMRLRGYNPVNDDEADALALLHCVLGQLKTIR
jgi:Holliday junction resolvasome RuvABC endonuclease subunit